MRRTASFVLSITALLFAGLLASSAAHAEEAWEKAFLQARDQQTAQLEQAARSGKGDMARSLANFAAVVDRYRQGARTQGSALSHYLYGRALFKHSEVEGHTDKRKKDEAIRSMEAAKSRGAGWFADYALAYIYFRTGEAERGEGYLQGLLRTHGDRRDVAKLQAQLLMSRRSWRELKSLAESWLKKNSLDMEFRQLLGMAYMGLKEWRRAETTFRSMIARGVKVPEIRLWIVECLVKQKKFEDAKKESLALIRDFPKEVDLRFVYAEVLMKSADEKTGEAKAKELKAAIAVLEQVVAAYPDHAGHKGRLSEIYLRTKQPAEAERVLLKALALCRSDERQKGLTAVVLRNLAFATFEMKRYKDAVRYLEELDRVGKGQLAPHILDLMQNCYGKLGRKKELISVLERMLEHMEGRPEERKQLEEAIKALKSGKEVTPQDGTTNEELWSRNKLAELVERCADRDVGVRRDALLEYYQLDLPFVDPVVYQRHDSRIERDPECRRLVVQILGRFRVGDANAEIVRIASRYVGVALEDPDRSVRTIAAQELGHIGAPAGLIYLMPYFERIDLDGSKLSTFQRSELEKEYNAARATLVGLTGREDIEPGAPNWVTLEAAAAHRKKWLAWYDTAEAEGPRMRALADLDTIDRVGPRWPLRYVLSDLMKQPAKAGATTTPNVVWLRTYKLMRRHVLRLKAKDAAAFAKDAWWPTFPIYEDKDLTAANIPAQRDALIAWWASLRKQEQPKK